MKALLSILLLLAFVSCGKKAPSNDLVLTPSPTQPTEPVEPTCDIYYLAGANFNCLEGYFTPTYYNDQFYFELTATVVFNPYISEGLEFDVGETIIFGLYNDKFLFGIIEPNVLYYSVEERNEQEDQIRNASPGSAFFAVSFEKNLVYLDFINRRIYIGDFQLSF